ncbi:hypothetical protein AVEN_196482-1 [Araneus ventricosus]|uniref:Uncharacterized protein n=1 Tax=Araneus ventricosus TaxID=182803 RepID=A0A4Y2TB31_ARAVE|nr:hypothetical protein AVEN_65587-1 [Araneus ventricosus]GBN97777.1 hypothetical protein AVEN_196482-1 [Araneus ventricosus]
MRKIWLFQTYACSFECLALSLEYANFKGKCYLLNWDGKFFGIIGMCGIKKLSPLAMPVITVAGTTFSPSYCAVSVHPGYVSIVQAHRRLISACRKVPLTILKSLRTLQDMILLVIAHCRIYRWIFCNTSL